MSTANSMVTLEDIKKHIHICKKNHRDYNWLGYVEVRSLSPEVIDLFRIGNGYDWQNGNRNLWILEGKME